MERQRLRMELLVHLEGLYDGLIRHLADNRGKEPHEIIWAVQEGALFLDDVEKEIKAFMLRPKRLEMGGQLSESLPGPFSRS